MPKLFRSIPGILFLIFLFSSGVVRAQCPLAAFSSPDSVCEGQSFLLTNTSDPGNTYSWDLCTGDLGLTPSGTSLGNLGSMVFPVQMRMIKDNGKYFLLIAEKDGNKLLRYDFGNSLDNAPVVYDYGNFGGILNQPTGMDVVREGGVWYAIIVNYGSQTLSRVDLGGSIEANIASAVDLGTYGSINAWNLKLGKDNNNYFAFISSTQFTRVDFGNSVTNAPSGATQITLPGTTTLGWGFDLGFDCAQNKFIGFYADFTAGKFFTLDFGNSLSNIPNVVGNMSTNGNPTGLTLIRDGVDYYVVVGIGNVSLLETYKLGTDLLAAPALGFSGQIGGINFPESSLIYSDSSHFYAFTSNSFPASASRITWPDNCFMAPSFSTDAASLNAVPLSGGYQHITIEATNANGQSAAYLDSIYVNAIPVSLFSTGNTCEGQPVQFTDLSTISSGAISSWTWDFGDTSPLDLQQNPVHIFPGPGPYNVTLTTQSHPSCSGNSYSAQISLFPLPSAAFSFPNNNCQFSPILFTDLSQAFGSTTLASWLWDFGDTTQTDTLQNPEHIYLLPGTYNVTLIVVTNTGCTDSLVQSITIDPAPVAEFSSTSTCIGETVNFINTSSIAGGGTINYSWNFGDNTTSNLINPTHQYASVGGNYDVQLIATASNNCTDTLVQNIHISNKPTPQFTWTPQVVCKGNPVTFINTSTGNGGDTIMVNNWDFGDATQSTDVNPLHAFADTGFYQVTLTVISPTDCDSTLIQQIYVIPSPVASFTATPVCLSNATFFNPTVVTPPGTVVDSIVWTFGDNTGFSGLTSPNHTYMIPGRYEVEMTVYNDLLCTGSFSDSVDVYPLPVAAYTTSLVCSGSPTTFDGTSSTIAGDTLSSWIWNFGGLGTGTDSIVQFTFQNANSYNVIMVVSSVHGCTDTTQQIISVIAAPDFDFVFNEPCLGLPAQFTFIPNVSPAPSSDLVWEFGDSTLSFLLNPSHVFATVDTFDVMLTVTEDSSGCSALKVKPLIIHPLPATGFIADDMCQATQSTILDTTVVSSGSIVAWDWNLGFLGTSSNQNPVITPQVPGVYPVSLTATTDFSCVATATGSFTVFAKPDAAIVPDPIFGSPPLTVNFINNSTGSVNFLWDFGDGTSGIGFTPSHVYSDTGNYVVSMIATSPQGCQDTAIATVSVLIPMMDIEVTEIFYTQTQDQIKLAARILNRGNVTVSSFQARGRLDQYSTIAEGWTGILAPGNQLLYIFESGYLIQQGTDPGYYCVDATYPNDALDANPNNNSKCSSLESEFAIFNVYPNPFEEYFTVGFNLNTEGPVELEVYDAIGKLAAVRKSAKGAEGYNSLVIPTNQLSKGIYTIVIRFRDEVRRIQAVKLK